MLQQTELRHIAKLARLSLTDAELATYTQQVDQVLDFFSQLHSVDVSGLAPQNVATSIGASGRNDVTHPSLAVEELLREAPSAEGNFFRVPKILDA
jgi:aspartyl-tRNA(Asn)/glutamyl-tRNA(Gln) amidotransferase subunit C